MVAVVRGEHSSAGPRSKTASLARGSSATRSKASASREKSKAAKAAKAEHPGLGPRLALGVGALVILGGALAGVLMARRDRTEWPRAVAAAHASPALARWLAPLGFKIEHVDVQGAPDMARADILRAAALNRDEPILGVSLDDLRQRVEATGWVKDAKIVRLLPDTLVIAVQPRVPAAVWQHLGVSHVIDDEGKLIGGADPGRFPDLPLVVGDGAAEEARNIMPLLRQRPALMTHIDALIRVDGRRWDLRLKDGSLIQLPAIGEDSALIQLDQLDQKQGLLSLGFERVDLRDPDAVAVRPRPSASIKN